MARVISFVGKISMRALTFGPTTFTEQKEKKGRKEKKKETKEKVRKA